MKQEEYKKVKRFIDSHEIECEICDSSTDLFHRTMLKSLKNMIEEKVIKPSKETGVVSLSASSKHTYGGTVRLKFNRSELESVIPTCYVVADWEDPNYRAYVHKRDEMEQRGLSPNRADAEMGLTSSIYKRECEVTCPNPIPLNKAKEIEYWITARMRLIEESSVSCQNRIPHSVDGSGWSGGTWDDIMDDINQVKALASRAKVPFNVKSCFTQVYLGWNKYIPLDDDNLERLSRGEEPLIVNAVPPEPSESNCRC